MGKYVIKRLGTGVLVLIGVIIITFLVTHMLPVDAAQRWAGSKATPEQIEAAREELGLNDPLPVQFVNYVKDLLRGDLGRSYVTRRPVMVEMAEAVPATLELIFYGSFVGIVVGIFLGIASARYKNRWPDHIIRFVTIGSVSIPSFALSIVLQLVLGVWLRILPISGRLDMITSVLYEVPDITGFLTLDCLLTGNWFMLGDALKHMILPAFIISLSPMGTVARMTRSSLLEIMGEDYITASRSYGTSEKKVFWVYALKNTMGTTATSTALTIGYALVNTFMVEAIFSWPGIGKYVSEAITQYNYPSIMGVTLFSTIAYLILNLIADLIVAVDPRVRL